jgi:hypothetical protein
MIVLLGHVFHVATKFSVAGFLFLMVALFRLQGERRAINFLQFCKRVDSATQDTERVCDSLADLGMIHLLNEEEIKNKQKEIVRKVVWWEYAGSYLKRKSWEIMPWSADTEHTMRIEMSVLVREEAKLDAWNSRLRNLMISPLDPQHMYLTPADIRHALSMEAGGRSQPSTALGRKTKRAKKEPVAAVHAPYGTLLQSSTPVSYQRDKKRDHTRQLVISCQQPDKDGDESSKSKEPLQVYFFPKSQLQRTYALHENPVLSWIREPSYTSALNGMGGAGDTLHVSALRDDEGVSSFF